MSLADQLLKAGLVDKKQVGKAKKERHEQRKKANKTKQVMLDESKLAAEQAKQEKLEKDKALNAQRKAEADQKALVAQIRQLIEVNQVDRSRGEVAYNFADDGKVKTIYVTDALQKQLTKGNLSIVSLDERYTLVPTGVAEKIQQRDASYVVLINDKQQTEDMDEDDPYADFQIPDDLMW